jgi:hypothetical protein
MAKQRDDIVKKLPIVILACFITGFFTACRIKHETYVKLLSNHLDDTIITLGRGTYAGGYMAVDLEKPGRKIFLIIEYSGYHIGDRLGVKIEELTGYSMHSTKVDATKFEVIDGKKVFKKFVDVPVYKVLELQTDGPSKD